MYPLGLGSITLHFVPLLQYLPVKLFLSDDAIVVARKIGTLKAAPKM